MKDLDIKKLLVFILIIALLILAVLGLGKLIGKGAKPSKEVQEQVDKLYTEYYSSLTEGYVTDYEGIDYLFEKEKTTYDDLLKGAIINTAIKYAQEKEFDTSISTESSAMIAQDYEGVTYSAYKAEAIRKAVKELFNKDLPNASVDGGLEYAYDFNYDEDADAYIMIPNDLVVVNAENTDEVRTKVLDTTKKGDKIIITLIVAYVNTDSGESNIYYSEKSQSENSRVGESNDDFISEKDKDFQKYTMTLAKADNNYVFESIEKAK